LDVIFIPVGKQVSWLEVETGETGEQNLVHAGSEAKQFYGNWLQRC